MTINFPVEIWLEIISLLPDHDLRKLIGVNRTLFEMVLDDIYRDIRLISDDVKTIQTFEELK